MECNKMRIILPCLLILFSCAHSGSDKKTTSIKVPQRGDTSKTLRAAGAEVFVVKPATKDFAEERMQKLKLKPGFRIEVFARGFKGPRSMVVAPNGNIYLAERKAGKVILLRDINGDGKADQQREVMSGLNEDLQGVHGLAIGKGRLYMVTDRELYSAKISADGSLTDRRKLISDLPDGGQHPNRTMAFGPDGRLYLSIGSTCNACPEPNKEAATMLRFDESEKKREIFAQGLRNTIGFAWHPLTGELWGMDHNTDYRGNDLPPEELNRLIQGRHYGWPECWGKQQVDWSYHEEPSNQDSRSAFCKSTEPSVLEYEAHAAPMMMVFYTGKQFPAEYKNDALVAMRGSWNRNPPYGYKIVRIKYDSQGKPLAFEDFVSGWLLENNESHFGRPMGLAVTRDGALLMSEDENGIIYRISYHKDDQ
jgi:glucose/arabinose dehydrogenase